MDKKMYDNCIAILKSELVPAMGCTEPIAIAYAAAKARAVLGKLPETIVARCSGNIIKNVKGVTVPNSGGLKGIDVAAILGAVGGKEDLELEVISQVTEEDRQKTRELLDKGICSCELEEGEENLYIRIYMTAGEDSSMVEIRSKHNHICRIEKNGEVVFSQDDLVKEISGDRSLLTVKNILEFADSLNPEDVEEVLGKQIDCNRAISEEGMTGKYGASVGKTLVECVGDDVRTRAKAAAAAGSDARMDGCPMPVVINSGSGNQGMTICLPILTYAEEMKVPREKLLRALALANLIAVHEKYYIGSLSAYCGATCAGCAAACGIAYLKGAGYEVISQTIVNAIANIGGMVCDGAKPSCAAKIASAVEAGLMGYELAVREKGFRDGEGLVAGDVEQTIQNLGRMGREGMKSTDVEILNIMIGK